MGEIKSDLFIAIKVPVTDLKPTEEGQEPRFLEMVKMHFDNAAKYCNVAPDMLASLKECHTVVRFNIPVQRDDGSLEVVPCYRQVFISNE